MTITNCSHCGLKLSADQRRPEEQGPAFCCVGCEAVYFALHDAGLKDFYALRSSWSGQAKPVDAAHLDERRTSIFDSPDFLAEHTAELEDGTRFIELHLEGVHCAGCVWLVERMPQLLSGVVDTRLELARARFGLRYEADKISLSEIARWLTRFGFQAHPLQQENVAARSSAANKMLIRVGVCWAVAANVMLLTIALYAGLDPYKETGLYLGVLWTTFLLSTVSLLVGGTVFFRRALAGIRTRHLSMDVPISLGVLVGWGHSALVTISGSGEVWFDSICVLIAALLTARYLQIRGNSLAADAAERLVALLPRQARRLTNSTGDVEVVLARNLRVGDRIEVLVGDVVPADGRIIKGASDVSRAVLTGESRPEKCAPGQALEAGTTNLTAPLWIEVTAAGEATRIGRLMEWVSARAKERAPIVQLADRLGSHFIAIVLIASAITAVAWGFIDPSRAVANVVALLVIACPCALGMATPLALTVGAGQSARRGIHIKHDDVIESLSRITDVVFDKTGTLTWGRPAVVATFGDPDIARRAALLELRSRHPLASAILDWARDHRAGLPTDLEIDDVSEEAGAGIAGVVDGQHLAIGRLSWFDNISLSARQWAAGQAKAGHTPVAVAKDGEVVALFAIGDALRPEARPILDKIRARGIKVHILSGDHGAVVAATANALGVDPHRARGNATPEEKRAYIEKLIETGARVAMIGDGVNDAAALKAATVGVAVDGGAEVSLVAADVFLVQSGIGPVEELLIGTRRVMNVVHRNLIGSGLYNLIGITLAACGFITPLVAAILMPISSLGVVASSLVQRSFVAPEETPTETPAKFAPEPLPLVEPAP